MKILRFTNNPSQLEDCWQKSIISTCQLPCFSEDLQYILAELPKNERKYWKFGFTRSQFCKACKTFKSQLRFCTDKTIAKWSKKSNLISYQIDEKDLFLFNDQVLFNIRKAKTFN